MLSSLAIISFIILFFCAAALYVHHKLMQQRAAYEAAYEEVTQLMQEQESIKQEAAQSNTPEIQQDLAENIEDTKQATTDLKAAIAAYNTFAAKFPYNLMSALVGGSPKMP